MRRIVALRFSLLASIGLAPLACGGSVRDGAPGGSGSGDRGPQPSTTEPDAGVPTSNTGGTPSVGGSVMSGHAAAAATGGGATFGGSSSSGGARPGLGPATCTNPQLAPDSGLVSCAEGYMHRAYAVECQPNNGGEAGAGGFVDPASLPRVDRAMQCNVGDPNACSQFQWGYCRQQALGVPLCESGCVSDAECAPSSFCVCGNQASPSGGSCVQGACRTDADCGAGSYCGSYVGPCSQLSFACFSPSDECRLPADCEPSAMCTYRYPGDGEPGRLHCQTGSCGRPFLVHDETRVAPVTRDSAWHGSRDALPDVERLTPFERAAQAARWTRMGQLEHASIAAFARFGLQLLALAAPPELVEACTQALADETDHARLCFRLASGYAGHAVGPGPLDITGSLTGASLADVVDLVIAEGCYGETIATLDAQDAAEEATDPVIGAAFRRIAEDEQRHAELAFRFLRWALTRDRALVRARIVRAVDASIDHSSGAREVVVPCLLALLRESSQPLEVAS